MGGRGRERLCGMAGTPERRLGRGLSFLETVFNLDAAPDEKPETYVPGDVRVGVRRACSDSVLQELKLMPEASAVATTTGTDGVRCGTRQRADRYRDRRAVATFSMLAG